MRLHNLTLSNFRVYAGEHFFDLSPRERYGEERPIILFGGLNGARKTSILSGIRLALYGRSALGTTVSQRRYDEYLLDSIHKPRKGSVGARSAFVSLSFSYAKLGVESRFTVNRNWERTGKSAKENLSIYQDDELISGLNYEQAQTFLNELIPIGVSDLFFFDGEKIAELAEDTGGKALEYSIKKLLGLDVVERLSADLSVLNRGMAKSATGKQIRGKIDELEAQLNNTKHEIDEVGSKISGLHAERAALQQQVGRLHQQLNDKGGHFVESRQDLHKKLDGLAEQRASVERDINQLLADKAPLALAADFSARLVDQIQQDLKSGESRTANEEMDKLAVALQKRLKAKLPEDAREVVGQEIEKLINARKKQAGDRAVHDVTVVQASTLVATLSQAKSQKQNCSDLFSMLEEIESDIDDIGESLARAPDDAVVQSDFENLQGKQKELGGCDERISQLKQQAKSLAQHALDIGKQLDKLYVDAAKNSDQDRILSYLTSTGALLDDFVHKTAKQKVQDLEEQFAICFAGLARKDDLRMGINIDPNSFTVKLVDDNGEDVNKDKLSAGEKQIFAISILEALAKTSGRQLPMIVDTPLGRLDSHHRKNLIENYFPRASHQMIILSTDTEVDEDFYKSLSRDISRAYRLDYDPKTGATSATEGYFWQKRKAV